MFTQYCVYIVIDLMETYTGTIFGMSILDPILARLMHFQTILFTHGNCIHR